MRITVLLGDPRLPYAYNLSNQFERQDHEAIGRLRGALEAIEEHAFELLDDHGRLWRELERRRPDFVLNFCNSGFRNRMERQHHVPALLEMLEIPYAGAGPECMVLTHHKFLVQALAADLGIPVPRQRLLPSEDPEAALPDAYPALIKPNSGDGSYGVTANAVVNGPEEARRYLRELRALLPSPQVLVQEYLPGPEYSVGVLGNPVTGLAVLPPLRIDFSELDPGLPPIMTYESKVDPQSPYWRKVRFRPAELSEAERGRLEGRARLLFERMGCRDYARLDFRCDARGEPRLLDLNPHPVWSEGGMLATMAGYDGRSYADLLRAILESGRRRLGL